MTDAAPVPGRRRPPLLLVVAVVIVIAVLLSSRGLDIQSTPGPSASADTAGSSSPTLVPSSVPSPVDPVSPTPSGPPPDPTPSLPPQPAAGDYLLMTKAELMARPTSGPAWKALVAIADGPIGHADLRNQDERHGVTTLAVALVYARTNDTAYRTKARKAVMAAIGTELKGSDNSILALGRQLGSYVLAADFIKLSGPDDVRFRTWLADIRTRDLGGHGRWTTLRGTHLDSANNWGAFAGASRIAASLYLGDQADVAQAAQVLRGFLGDKGAWDRFQPVEGSASWACQPKSYVPVNPPCVREGLDLDGAIVRDISRGGSRRWPPGDDGVSYTLESLQGLTVQAELLTHNGYGDAWSWSDEAIRRATGIVTRSGLAGGETWNRSPISFHLSWLLNARYGLDLPTKPAGQGRLFGYTDWLYGG